MIQFKDHSFTSYFSVFDLCYLRNPCGLRSDPIEMDIKNIQKTLKILILTQLLIEPSTNDEILYAQV